MIQLVSEKIKWESLDCLYLFFNLMILFCVLFEEQKISYSKCAVLADQSSEIRGEDDWSPIKNRCFCFDFGHVSKSLSNIYVKISKSFVFQIVFVSNCFKLKLSISYVTQLQDESRKQRKHCIWCLFFHLFSC